MSLRICFLAPSGYGKTTASEILNDIYKVKIIKIGTPLYELQKEFYNKLGINLGATQDGELLQFFGYKIRKESPDYLLNVFNERFLSISEEVDIIINDDCRPYDYEYLKSKGFIFIKINGYKHDRNDHSEIDYKSSLEWKSDIPYDYEIDNFNSLEEYKRNLLMLVEEIKNDRKVLCHTCKEGL